MRCISAGGRTFALFGLAGALAGCGDGKQAPAPAAPPLPSPWSRSVAEDIRPQFPFTGRVEAIYQVDLRARVHGFLEKRLFTEGADVKEGDLLFMIEKGLYPAAATRPRPAWRPQRPRSSSPTSSSAARPSWSSDVGAQAQVDDTSAKQGEARGALLQQKAAWRGANSTQLHRHPARRSPAASAAPTFASAILSAFERRRSRRSSARTDLCRLPVTQREILAYRAEGSSQAFPPSVVLPAARRRQPLIRIAGRSISSTSLSIRVPNTVRVRASPQSRTASLVDGQLVRSC